VKKTKIFLMSSTDYLITLQHPKLFMATREELPDDSILIKGESKIFTEPSEPDNRDKKIKQLRGLLKDHREIIPQ